MAISLKLLRKFERVKVVIDQRDEHKRALEHLREQSAISQADLVGQLATLSEDRDNLSRAYGEIASSYDALTRERDALARRLDSERWLVKDAGGITLLLDKDSLVDLHVFYHDRWEKDRLEYLLEMISKIKSGSDRRAYFFDVGAYFGQYSLVVKQMMPDIHVFSFEANTYNYIQLRANLLLNDLVDKITSYNCCVTNERGKTSISRPDRENRGAAAVGAAYTGTEKSPFVVDNLVVDEEFSSISDSIIFMKMDIEGSEAAALAGMKSFFSRNMVLIQIEDWEFPGGRTSQILAEFGFSLVRGMHPDYFYSNFDVSGVTVEASDLVDQLDQPPQ